MSDNKNKREFGLSSLAINNRTTVLVLTVIILILGGTAYKNMPKETYPEIAMPTIFVGTAYPGNSPIDIENLVTKVIEKEVNGISGINKLNSVSAQDFSQIIVEFDPNIEAEEALKEVKDAVDKIKKDLPNDLPNDPDIFELDFSEFPIMNVNLSGDFSIDILNDYGEYLKDEMEDLGDVSKVEIRGVQDKEVKIKLDLLTMESMEINFRDVENAIAGENITMSGGGIIEDGIARSVRVVGEYKTPEEFYNIIVKNEKQRLVYLSDIATVEFDYEDPVSYARSSLDKVVMLDIIKASGGNLITASQEINQIIDFAKENVFPKDLEISITNDQSDMTRSNVSNLENSIIIGVILVILTLLFFLGFRNSLFVGVAIPMSMYLSFVILDFIGFHINMMVLFGLIMALGMLVDNGIVVVENIYRMMQEGKPPLQAAKEGVGEVAMPIISSTATTLAAFLPLAFWPGMMGEFMKYLPITLIVVLTSSLFVALVINPVFTSMWMKIEDLDKGSISNKKRVIIFGIVFLVLGILFIAVGSLFMGNIFALIGLLIFLVSFVLIPASTRFQRSFLPWLENKYENIVTFALKGRKPHAFFWGTFGLLIFVLVLFGTFLPKVLFFPENEPNYLNVFIEFPTGTDIDETDEFTYQMEEKVADLMSEYDFMIESIIAQVGKGSADPNDPNSSSGSIPENSRIQVSFVESKYRNGVSTNTIKKELEENIGQYPGVSIAVAKESAGPPTGKPINIEISGLEFDSLYSISTDVKRLINNSGIKGIDNLQSDLTTDKAELIIELDREKARRLGLSTSQIAMDLRTSIYGKEVSKFKEGDDDYPIVIRLDDEYRYDRDALLNKKIIYRDQASGRIKSVPISSVANTVNSNTIGSINRKNMNRMVTLFSNVSEGYNANEINNELRELLADKYEVPAGYSVDFAGEQQEQAKEMEYLSTALIMGVFLIFLIIVAQFNKVSAPVMILISVLMSTIGVFLGLVVFQMEFVVIMTMLGIISLAGIVVNNAIVLIDYIDLTKKRVLAESGKEIISLEQVKKSIVIAGKTRLRPVLLTAITTVLGLVPMAVGFNIDFFELLSAYDTSGLYFGGDTAMFWKPMSKTIIFGVTFATFLTLVFVPVMYYLIDKLKVRVGRSLIK